MPVTSYRPGQVAELLGVSVDTVRRWADSGRLRTRRTDAGRRVIDGEDLARFLTEHAPEPGDDVPAAASARNRFAGIVTSVVADKVVAQVELRCGPHRVVSLLTAEAVDELGLAPGVAAVAVVKATNVVVEVRPL
ncbi:MAG: TOBE domain-containing protein [Acidimicrobiales bacterium]